MKIALLSDTRLPTSLNYGGHGLGRAVARLATGLVARGHDVTVFAGYGSEVPGCTVIEHSNEDQRAYMLAAQENTFDVWIDGSHRFQLAYLREDWPMVCKPVDKEGQAPRNRVYNNAANPAYLGQGAGMVINEGIDIDTIPFGANHRSSHALFAGLLSAGWKRPDQAVEVAKRAEREIWLMGDGGPLDLPADKQIPAKCGQDFYNELSSASVLIMPIGGTVTLEAAACGTPSISLWQGDSWIEDGVSGFVCEDVRTAAERLDDATHLDPIKMREWVASERSVAKMAEQWEAVLALAANGERW